MSEKVQMDCPKCGAAEMWDNRASKTNPKAPDFKCVDRNCEGVVWPPKKGAAPVAKGRSGVAKPYNTPKALPNEFDGYEQEETADLNAHTGHGTQSCEAPSKSALMLTLHGECFKYAYNRLKKANEGADPALIFTGSDVLAYTAQLFIAADRKGIASLAA